MTSGGRTALVVVTSEAEDVLAPWRQRFLGATVERGIPTHITVLFPFVPARELDASVEESLRRLCAAVTPFAYELVSVESFPGFAWLAPRPEEPFRELIARMRAAYPEFPPYGDEGLPVVPHCTVGAADDPDTLAGIVCELQSALATELPIGCRADAVTLLEERADETWTTRAAFAFEAAA